MRLSLRASDIPQEWQDALEAIRVHFPQAVIAGGALRDLWHDKPVKDIDVFIPVSDAEENLWADQVHDLDCNYKVIQTNVYGQEGNQALPGFRTLHAIYRLTNYSLPIELIFIKAESDGKPVSSAFDISICQIEFNGSWVLTSQAFLNSIANQTIDLCNVNRADRQEARLQRMRDKYPEYKIIVPDDTLDPYPGDYDLKAEDPFYPDYPSNF